ncbi:MAG TPA: hypothetical protein VKV38_10465 [Trebonia sp.]|nr:hypothetical protein [Trebonia sp.]
MTTVYVVPCGISVFDELGTKMPVGGSPVRAFTHAVTNGNCLAGVCLDDGEAVTAKWAARAAARAEAAGLARVAPKRLSAETHSLATRLRSRPLAPGEHVLLLASDTPLGVSAAFCVGQYLAGAGSGQVAYISSPRTADDPFQLAVTRVPVTVVRVRGLKPDADLSTAAIGIGKVLRAAGDAGGRVEVHLTGGYKATLLHTLAMSEVLHSMWPGRVSAWNVFEDVADPSSDQPVQPQPIGLRTFPREYLTLMRSELTAVRDGSAGFGRTFQGLGWDEEADGTRRLNAFGHGYLAVLGESPAALGDDKS